MSSAHPSPRVTPPTSPSLPATSPSLPPTSPPLPAGPLLKRKATSPIEQRLVKVPRIVIDATWNDGNFTVVSSDGVTFRVKDYILFSVSSVFADFEFFDGEKRIELTDPEIETAAIFRLFLQVATTLDTFGPGLLRYDPDGVLAKAPLLMFLDKWDCTALSHLVIDNLQHCFTAFPLQCFQVAALIDRPDMCADVLEATTWRYPYVYQPRDDPWCDEDAGCENPLDPEGWSLQFEREHKIPRDYLYALKKAFRGHELNGNHIDIVFIEVYEMVRLTPNRVAW